VIATPAAPATRFDTDVQSRFLNHLPRIQKHARYALRHVPDRDAREELFAEALALAWKHFAALVHCGCRLHLIG
jgi:hypothetical protein